MTNRKQMWFGTQHHAEWVNAPLRDADMSPEGWGTTGTYLTGGGFGRNSQDSHRNYIFEWPGASSRQSAATMQAYRDGVYSKRRHDPIYFIDPLIYDQNILPKRWAQPGIVAPDSGAVGSPLGLVTPIESNIPGLPFIGVEVASQTRAEFEDLERPGEGSVWIPIPEGMELRIVAWANHSTLPADGLFYKTPQGFSQKVQGVISVSGERGVFLGTVGTFEFFGARAILIPKGKPPPSPRWDEIFTHSWDGVPGDSRSRRMRNDSILEVVARNLIFNGQFRYSDENGNLLNWTLETGEGLVYSYPWDGFGGGVVIGAPEVGVASNTITITQERRAASAVFKNYNLESPVEVKIAIQGTGVTGIPASGELWESPWVDLEGREEAVKVTVSAPKGAAPRARVLLHVRYSGEGEGGATVLAGSVMLAAGDTEEEALDAVATFFDGDTPMDGPEWTPGLGHSGCMFVGNPTWAAVSGVNGGQIGYAASFKEIGDWQK